MDSKVSFAHIAVAGVLATTACALGGDDGASAPWPSAPGGARGCVIDIEIRDPRHRFGDANAVCGDFVRGARSFRSRSHALPGCQAELARGVHLHHSAKLEAFYKRPAICDNRLG
jgi:hypothetical protein